MKHQNKTVEKLSFNDLNLVKIIAKQNKKNLRYQHEADEAIQILKRSIKQN